MKDGFTGMEVFVLCVVWALIGIVCGRFIEESASQKDAIKAGVAEYYLDKDNNKQFRWKAPHTQ